MTTKEKFENLLDEMPILDLIKLGIDEGIDLDDIIENIKNFLLFELTEEDMDKIIKLNKEN